MKRLLAIFVCFSASAATYFVDFATGSDSNNGTSTSTPWQHSPGDANATANANITPAAGDTIVFKGGVTYIGMVTCNASGTSSGNRITYISGHLHSTPWPDANTVAILTGSTTRQFGFNISSRNWIKIAGMEIKDIGAPTADAAGINIEGGDNALLEYNFIHDVNENVAFTLGYGIENNHGDSHIIRFNVVSNCSDKLLEWWGGGSEPSGGASTQDANFSDVHHNLFINGGVHGVVITGDSNSFHHNIVIEAGHKSGFPNPGFGLKVDQGSWNTVYDNLFINCQAGLGVLVGYTNSFYNNTLYGVNNSGQGNDGGDNEAAIALYNEDPTPAWGSSNVKANKFIGNIIHYIPDVGTTTKAKLIFYKNDAGEANIVSSNSFYAASSDVMSTGTRVRFNNGSNNYKSLTAFESDFNSDEGGTGNLAQGNVAGDQLFSGGALSTIANLPTGWNATFTAPNNTGLKLTVQLAGHSIAGVFTTDILDVTRSSWTMGAYEFVSSATNKLTLAGSVTVSGNVTLK